MIWTKSDCLQDGAPESPGGANRVGLQSCSEEDVTPGKKLKPFFERTRTCSLFALPLPGIICKNGSRSVSQSTPFLFYRAKAHYRNTFLRTGLQSPHKFAEWLLHCEHSTDLPPCERVHLSGNIPRWSFYVYCAQSSQMDINVRGF